MKVLFGVASPNYLRHEALYKAVEGTIKAQGHTLCFEGQKMTLVESYGEHDNLDNQDWEVMCRREMVAAESCDAAIFDVTNKASFGIGYMAAICLSRNTPTLFLMAQESLKGSFITGLIHPTLMRKQYNPQNVQKIISDFLAKERG